MCTDAYLGDETRKKSKEVIVLEIEIMFTFGWGLGVLSFFRVFIFKKKLFIWLHWVLAVAHRIFYLHCNMWSLFFFSLVACGIEFPDQKLNKRPSALGAWRLSHWTATEVPGVLLRGTSTKQVFGTLGMFCFFASVVVTQYELYNNQVVHLCFMHFSE